MNKDQNKVINHTDMRLSIFFKCGYKNMYLYPTHFIPICILILILINQIQKNTNFFHILNFIFDPIKLSSPFEFKFCSNPKAIQTIKHTIIIS